MVDLHNQYLHVKDKIDAAIQEVIDDTAFINGKAVKEFREKLSEFTGAKHTVSCGNGTDALQIALMALELKEGDEVVIPAFTYIATAEVIALLNLKPVLVDVNPDTFNIDPVAFEQAISPKTKAVMPVHLFGQSAEMELILDIAHAKNLFVIEDNAQAIGAEYRFSDGTRKQTGTMGDIGCTSFFPSKNLGCYGDGGAIFSNNDKLAEKMQMIANHGQNKKYYHRYIGLNSRLDSIQAAVLNVKLDKLKEYNIAREQAAGRFDNAFSGISGLKVPMRAKNTTHVFHQYTLQTEKRDELKQHLAEQGIPSAIYYPLTIDKQEAFKGIAEVRGEIKNAEELTQKVLSLPMHTELSPNIERKIIEAVSDFFG